MRVRDDLRDLWTAYKRLGPGAKEDLALPLKSYFAAPRDSRSSRRLVYVVRRSAPKAGHDYGNFAVGRAELRRLVRIQEREDVLTYVALVEDWDGAVVTHAAAEGVLQDLDRVEPYRQRDGGAQYWWVNDDLRPIGTARAGGGDVYDESPF